VDEVQDFEAWYRQVHPRLVATLALVTGDLDLTREAVDEACSRAVAAWPRVSTMSSPDGWTYRVALNVARRRLRRRQLERGLLGRLRPPSETAPPELPGPTAELRTALAHLTERQRMVFGLRYVADLAETEIARSLGISRSTVSSTLADARARLQPLLANEMLPEGDGRV
jgi:RNA polymerase sigma factor (sigma-70 family)